MKKVFGIIIIVIISAAIGAGTFSLVIAKRLYFPEVKKVADDTAAGLQLTAYTYSPWFWNQKKISIINIWDRKNDAPNFQYKIFGEINDVRLIYSGEDFALIVYSDPDFSSMESGYIVHRSLKSEGDNTVEKIHIGGNIIAVAPDESGYFYISDGILFKRSWVGETLSTINLGMDLEPILDVQLIGVGFRSSNIPVLFFSDNKKMSFVSTPLGERDPYIFIINLENNSFVSFLKQDFADYDNLTVEDDKLCLERRDVVVLKKIIAE